jgi:hypothetical protein
VLLSQIRLSKRSNRNVGLILLSILLFLFAALRGNGDGDYFNYLRFSEYITDFTKVLDFRFPMEIGFRIIAYLTNLAGLPPQMVIAAMNLVSIGCVSAFVKKYSPDKPLSMLVFLPLFLQYDMHAARTAVAMAIGLFSFPFLLQQSFLKYTGVVALAGCFHLSAWILLPMYFIGHLKVQRIVGFGTILGLLLLRQIISTSEIALSVLRVLGLESSANRLQIYMESTTYGYSFALYDPRFILALGTYMLATRMLDRSDPEHNLMINYTWVNSLVMLFFSEHTALVTRLSAFFSVFSIVVIPHMIISFKSRNVAMARTIKLAYVYVFLLYTVSLCVRMVEYVFFF